MCFVFFCGIRALTLLSLFFFFSGGSVVGVSFASVCNECISSNILRGVLWEASTPGVHV